MDYHPSIAAGPEDLAPPTSELRHRTSCINFSLETAIIVIMVFGVGALFSCCYHWGLRLQHNQAQAAGSGGGSLAPTQSNLHNNYASMAVDPSALIPLQDVNSRSSVTQAHHQKAQQMEQAEFTMQVLMPGDDVPKFLAWTAPRQIPSVLDSTAV